MQTLILILAALFPAFDAEHQGVAPTQIHATATWHPVLGPVIHDGLCAYAPQGKLGCFDPASTGDELGCGKPEVTPAGVYWLYLHRVLFAPYGGAPSHQDLPLWVYEAALEPGTDALLIWGMGDGSKQELWRWDPRSGTAAARILTGPAEMSGGVSPWPGAPGCLALASYAPHDQPVCKGETTLWLWCAAAPLDLAPMLRFPGCSGSIAVTGADVWVEFGAHADVRPLSGAAASRYDYPADEIARAADGAGVMQSFRFQDGRLSVQASFVP